MTLPQLLFAAVVFLVGIPAAFRLRPAGFPIGLRNLTALALVAWFFYAVTDPWAQWWGLWLVSLAQFLVVGGEAFAEMWADRAANARSRQAQDPPSSGAEFALHGERLEYG